MVKNKYVIHVEYDYDPGEELCTLIKAMHNFSEHELRLWIIQELTNFDNELWPVVEIGTQILKDKIKAGQDRDKAPD